jgi:hypothetical protein
MGPSSPVSAIAAVGGQGGNSYSFFGTCCSGGRGSLGLNKLAFVKGTFWFHAAVI